MSQYESRLKPLSAARFAKPVIVLVDNDKGSTDLFGAAKKASKREMQIDGSRPFYHIIRNLYVIAIPKTNQNEDIFIENLLPKSILETELSGKKFELDQKKFDRAIHYGKAILAENVVKRNQKNIDFKGFVPLLENIASAIEDYESQVV